MRRAVDSTGQPLGDDQLDGMAGVDWHELAADEQDAVHLMDEEAAAQEPSVPPIAAGLDWVSHHDAASLEHDARQRLGVRVPLQDWRWSTPAPLDQGAEGACVGYAVATSANVRRASNGRVPHLDEENAADLYHLAQDLDEVAGDDYEGTSLLAGMKAGQRTGLWDAYVWCFDVRTIVQAVLQLGPVLVGVPWTAGMYVTDAAGRLQLTGATVGGHCLTVVGVQLEVSGEPGPWAVLLNSWGPDWGLDGIGYVKLRQLAWMLAGIGEAAVPLPALRA
jgi:hypothetical protein